MTNINILPNKQNIYNQSSVDHLLDHLFADKRTVYIDDINFSADGGYDVSWCLDFTLKMSSPQWMDTHFERAPLIAYITRYNLNQWETYRYCPQTGNVQPYTETTTDLEGFLDEYYKDVIQRILEEREG